MKEFFKAFLFSLCVFGCLCLLVAPFTFLIIMFNNRVEIYQAYNKTIDIYFNDNYINCKYELVESITSSYSKNIVIRNYVVSFDNDNTIKHQDYKVIVDVNTKDSFRYFKDFTLNEDYFVIFYKVGDIY